MVKDRLKLKNTSCLVILTERTFQAKRGAGGFYLATSSTMGMKNCVRCACMVFFFHKTKKSQSTAKDERWKILRNDEIQGSSSELYAAMMCSCLKFKRATEGTC